MFSLGKKNIWGGFEFRNFQDCYVEDDFLSFLSF